MKRITIINIIICIICSILFTACVVNDLNHSYTLNGTITEINTIDNSISIIDENGEVWEIIDSEKSEEWTIDKKVVITLNDNNTENIFDDVIIAVYAE